MARSLDDFTRSMVVEYISDQKILEGRIVREYEGAACISLDFETSGLDPHTGVPWLMPICKDGSNIVHVIDTQRCDIRPLKDVLESTTIKGANLSFDLKWLRIYGIRPRKVIDVVIRGRVISAGLMIPNTLTALCQRNLGFELPKEVRSSFIMHPEKVRRLLEADLIPVWTEEQVRYAAIDTYVLEELVKCQEKDITREGLWPVLTEAEDPCVPVISDMEYDGIYADEDEWLALAETVKKEQMEVYNRLCKRLTVKNTQTFLFPEVMGSEFKLNLNSGAEVKKRFLDIGIKTDTLDKDVLKHIKHPVVQDYVKWKGLDKQKGTYGPTWIAQKNPNTGRIHTHVNQTVDTGRMSSSDPNIQNLPAKDEYRWCFKPRPGYKFVDVDYSQMELRILAEFSGDRNLIEVFVSGIDLHSATAAKMFNRPLDECLDGAKDANGKPYKWRKYGKTINFAMLQW